jgi:alpha-ketoglutarate-dependent taurine dioxygenase
MTLAAPAQTITYRPLTDVLGAEVVGIDLSAAFDQATSASLRDAFSRYGLLLVRGQSITTADQTRFAELFGQVVIREKNVVASTEVKAQHVSNSRKDGILGLGELDFHMDQLFHQKPLLGLALYGIEIPDSGGDTLFTNACAAYESMPEPLRRKVDSLNCRHAYTFAGELAQGWNIDDAQVQPLNAVHPMAPKHPVSGRRALWVNKMTTVEVVGMAQDEGQALMKEVRSYLYAESITYRHKWKKDDLLIWDNRALMHARTPFDESQPRTLRRSPIL